MTRSSSFQAAILTTVALGALCAGGGVAQAQFKQTDLASDVSGIGAAIVDPNLVNTWGVSAIAGATPFWISNQGTGTSSLFSVTGRTGVAAANIFPPGPPPGSNFVTIPPPVVAGFPGPTGQVSNPTAVSNPAGASFNIGTTGPALFIFANLNGSISAWNMANVPGGNAATVVAPPPTSGPGALYTGLAMNNAGNLLYAANGITGAIDVFNGSFVQQPTSGFVDPNLPPGYVPFNVEDIGGQVYVSYALAGHGPQTTAMAGQGAVAVFSETGAFMQELVGVAPAGTGELASPWGMAIAPAGFGPFGGDLLVGNFSFNLSEINAFNATTGAFAGTIDVDPGAGQTPGGLWDLMFGGGGPTGDPMTLYFTDGINGETHGLFAALTVPEPASWAMMLIGFGSLGLFAARRRRGAAAIG
jgi:uncharacterized protein (TIGR03118 family)